MSLLCSKDSRILISYMVINVEKTIKIYRHILRLFLCGKGVIMKRVYTRACIRIFYVIHTIKLSKHLKSCRDKVEFLRVVWGVAIGKIKQNNKT